jgi:small ligand-binding sensory domain FIST
VKWASAVARSTDLESAVIAAVADALRDLDAPCPELILAFVSSHFTDELDRVTALVRAQSGGGLLVGCTAGGVIGGGSEVEGEPAVSITVAQLPGVEMSPFYLAPQAVADAGARDKWQAAVRCEPSSEPSFVLLADPFSCPADRLLAGLDSTFPAGSKIGGLASGATRPGSNRLYLGGNSYAAGAVGIALTGNLVVDTVVSQGCRPIGDPMFVTACRDNLILDLDGTPAIDVLRHLYERLSSEDRELFRHALFLGLVMNERQQSYGPGDFLIRNLLGVNESPRSIAVGAALHENMVVQFHLRDRRTAAGDLQEMLGRYAVDATSRPPAGALLFSCLGRGAGLYGVPDHDSRMFRSHVGDVPLGGFFCNGEIGQVQGSTYLHGYTSAFGMFRARDDA